MTPDEKTIVHALVAVAWVDGEMAAPEADVIHDLLRAFDASPEESAEILEFAKTPRTLRDVDVSSLSADDRYTLLRNAAQLVCSDGQETEAEVRLVGQLAEILELGADEVREVVVSVRGGVETAMEPPSTDLKPR